MNYQIINRNPLDLLPNKGIGISIPFDGPTGLNITYESKDAIRNNLLNFLLTGQRERILNPNFGTGIRNQIFEQITNGNLQVLEKIIYDGITNYFPIIAIEELQVNANNNTVQVFVRYSIINTNITDDFQINFNND